MDMMRPVSLELPPVAPIDLAFDTLTMTLSWTDNSLSETAFVVEKSVDGGVNWTTLGQIDRLLTDPNTKGGVESIADPAWVSGDQYRVFAQNTVGDTWDYSNPNLNEILPGTFAFPVVTTKSAYANITVVSVPPLAPSNLSATNIAQTSLTLNWADNSNSEDGFTIETSIDNFVTILGTYTVGANLTSLDISGLTPSTMYYFRVAAFNGSGASLSDSLAATTLDVPPPTAPLAPSALFATSVAQTSLTLNWVDNSNNEDGFTVEIADINGVLGTFPVGLDVTSLDFTGLTPNTSYYFRVEAFNAVGPSGWSAALPVTTLVTPPLAPSSLSAANVTQTSLTLNWVDNSADETGFNVQIAAIADFSSILNSLAVGADVTSLDFTGLTPNSTYYFRVEAFNAGGTSGWSFL
jgi:hypothetical protein